MLTGSRRAEATHRILRRTVREPVRPPGKAHDGNTPGEERGVPAGAARVTAQWIAAVRVAERFDGVLRAIAVRGAGAVYRRRRMSLPALFVKTAGTTAPLPLRRCYRISPGPGVSHRSQTIPHASGKKIKKDIRR